MPEPEFAESRATGRALRAARASRLNTPGQGQGARWAAKALGRPLPPRTGEQQPIRYRAPIALDNHGTHLVLFAPAPSAAAIYLRASRVQPGPATRYAWVSVAPSPEQRGNWTPTWLGPKFASPAQAVVWALERGWLDRLPQADPESSVLDAPDTDPEEN